MQRRSFLASLFAAPAAVAVALRCRIAPKPKTFGDLCIRIGPTVEQFTAAMSAATAGVAHNIQFASSNRMLARIEQNTREIASL